MHNDNYSLVLRNSYRMMGIIVVSTNLIHFKNSHYSLQNDIEEVYTVTVLQYFY